MGRDPEYLAFMREVEKGVAVQPPLSESIVEERASHLAGRSGLRRRPVALVEDLALTGADGVIPARLYHPDPGTERPGLVYFHGGGFYLGSIESYDPIVRALVTETGCAFVSVEYPLAPECPYPAAADCALDATLDVARRARELGLDPNTWFRSVELAAFDEFSRETVDYVANINRYYVAYKLSQDRLRSRGEAIDAMASP
jgi:acetyl esterase